MKAVIPSSLPLAMSSQSVQATLIVVSAGPSRHLAVGVGHVGNAAFLPAHDRVDLGRVVKRVEHREKAFAWNSENTVAALDPKLVDEDAAAGAFGHARGLAGVTPVVEGGDPAAAT